MYSFHSIKELLNTLAWAKDLLSEMFGKRKSFSYKYDQAIELIDEKKLVALIEKGILVRNGRFIEIDDQFLAFFEQILDVNEEINVSYINGNIQLLKENINYYLLENSESRKYKYLRTVKSALRKIGYICLRNVVDLNRNIDNTFKSEPNYKVKISKLKNYDQKREDISLLIVQTERLLNEDEKTFFALALDEELKQINLDLRLQLQEATHNLIEIQKQIIDFLNQVKHQSKVIEKMRQVKYLKDQFELEAKSNIEELISRNNAVIFENRITYPVKISLDTLQDDEVHNIILELSKKFKSGAKSQVALAKKISNEFLNDSEEGEVFVNIEEMKNNFIASGHHLFDFVINYEYPKDVSFEEKVTYFCQLISVYENELELTDQYMHLNGTEYSVVYPKQN